MPNLIHIADRVLNRPLLITRDKAQVILSVLSGRIGVNSPDASRFEGTDFVQDENGRYRSRPYNVKDGVAIISITGSLVNRGAWVGANSGLTSYEGIQHQLKSALDDGAVHSAILDIHSPGGEAVGAFETAEHVRSLAKAKRTIAVVNGMAASAAYAIASGASEIVTTETGVSGSIGVVLMHADFSAALKNDGIDPTLIFAGAHKVDGNPFEPLPDSVRDDLQTEVNAFYDMFVKTVAKGRGNRTTAKAARDTEARTFIGQSAVEAGLADRVGSFESVLAELRQTSGAQSGRATVQKRSTSMDKQNETPGAETETGITQAALDAAIKKAEADGFAKGAKAENERIRAIEANAPAGLEALVAEHKADMTMTPEKSAMAILASVKEKGIPGADSGNKSPDAVFDRMDQAAAGVTSTVSGGAGGAAPKATTPDGWKAEYEASESIRKDFPTCEAYVSYMKRQAAKAA